MEQSQFNEIKSDLRKIKKKPDLGTLASILLITATIASVKSCNRTGEILDKYQKVPAIQTQDVIGQETPEKFYDLNGQRFYLEIDGKPVEKYFTNKQ